VLLKLVLVTIAFHSKEMKSKTPYSNVERKIVDEKNTCMCAYTETSGRLSSHPLHTIPLLTFPRPLVFSHHLTTLRTHKGLQP